MFTIDSIGNLIQSKFSSFIKKGINISPHLVPLNFKVLNRSLGGIVKSGISISDFRKFSDSLFNYVRSKYPNTIVLKQNTFTVNGKDNVPLADLLTKFTPALVFTNNNSKDNFVGVLFNSFNSANAELLNDSIRRKVLDEINRVLGPDSEVDLAYIFRDSDNPSKSNSIKNFFGIFNSISKNNITVPGVSIPNDKSGLIHSRMVVESLLKDYATYEERAFGTYSVVIDKQVSEFVTKIKADILIVHDSKVKEQVQQVVKSNTFINFISKILPSIKQTETNFIQDITNRIRSVFLGKKPSKPKEQSKTSGRLQSGKSTVKLTESKGVNSEFIIPPAFISLTNLQNLINRNLHDYVKERMGTGNSTSVLNYRTGRLANSFQVTGVSQTRDGALTAFFTYMKYPYATFSKGGLQSEPASRDPVLLGERAIRAIASEVLGERLRAVGI